MKNEDGLLIGKMIEYCNDIISLTERFGKSIEAYNNDIAFRYSCGMCIIQIGELSGRVSDSIKDRYGSIPWKNIKAARNIHAHNYDNVIVDVAWETILFDIPELKHGLETILKDIEGDISDDE